MTDYEVHPYCCQQSINIHALTAAKSVCVAL
jgi:hypothetical protein